MAPLVSPPSLTPSIHPPKRCKMERNKPSLPNGFLCPPPGVVSLPNSPCSESSTLQRTLVMKQAGAINVNCCDRFNRKRLQQGKASLADLATTKEGKELLKKRTWKEVFVYDECSESLENLPSSHTLFLVMNALVEDHREPVMLLGGLRDFQVTHRGLCEDHLMHSNSHRGGGPQPVSPSSKYLPDLPSPSEIYDKKDIENHPASQVLPHL